MEIYCKNDPYMITVLNRKYLVVAMFGAKVILMLLYIYTHIQMQNMENPYKCYSFDLVWLPTDEEL